MSRADEDPTSGQGRALLVEFHLDYHLDLLPVALEGRMLCWTKLCYFSKNNLSSGRMEPKIRSLRS